METRILTSKPEPAGTAETTEISAEMDGGIDTAKS